MGNICAQSSQSDDSVSMGKKSKISSNMQKDRSEKSAAVASSHAKITKQFSNSRTMAANEADLDQLSRVISKMPGRSERVTIEQTIDTLFEVASSKMQGEDAKKVLANLRKHVN